jgi:hypothetical protein
VREVWKGKGVLHEQVGVKKANKGERRGMLLAEDMCRSRMTTGF